jgi:iron complex outermembrane recepter protein
MKIAPSLLLLFYSCASWSQGIQADSSRLLEPVLIQAYATGRPLSEVPAAIGYIDTELLDRFNNTSLLPAVNTIPGVRMEERSPGSYRFSIRGSLLRSPFGVRNVKAYWNGFPLTDAGGNTYLNLIDFNAVGNLEVIKGPGASLYGAGTGGVILLRPAAVRKDQVEFSAVGGSYGLRRSHIRAQMHSGKLNVSAQYAHQQAEGYRKQTAMRRNAINADFTYRVNATNILSATLFYTDLFYETPGGLTQLQYDENAREARPAGGPNRGAEEQHAAARNKTPFVGLALDHDWNENISTHLATVFSYSDFRNPAIRNYEERFEHNLGLRTETQVRFGTNDRNNKLTFGAETQRFVSPLKVYDNEYGEKAALQTSDDLTSSLLLIFAQTEWSLPADFYLTLGGSLNFLEYGFTRSQPLPISRQRKRSSAVFSPRAALLKKFGNGFSVYANASRGFSPPSLAEVRPSTNTFNDGLDPETGINYEVGMRRSAMDNLFAADLTLYDFRLDHTIVIQRAADGAEYFINAGKTRQRGLELFLSWNPIQNATGNNLDVKFWNSYSYNHYRFKKYIQDNADYSGKKLTGIPPVTNTGGVDLVWRRKTYLNITATYVDHVPLNDANSVYANEYFLVGCRAGFKTNLSQHALEVFAGVDNALDQRYSLGNDLNAIGGRYFNAAPGINLYAGLKFTVNP